MTKFTHTQVKRFKSNAKKQSVTQSIHLHQALDDIAHAQGYSNWALMIKHAGPPALQSNPQFAFVRTIEEMRERMLNQPQTIERVEGRHARPYIDVPDIWQKFKSPMSVVNFAIDYMTLLLSVPRFSVGRRSHVYWEMRLWLPYAVETEHGTKQLLVNREYKPVGMDITTHVEYGKYPAFHTRMQPEQIDSVSHRPTGHGYLYGDSPWSSRKAAEVYLRRLNKLKAALKP